MRGPENLELAGARAPDGTPVPVRELRGFSITRLIARKVLRAGGWTISGDVPDLPKMVCILGKHTSNWDGVWCVALMFAMDDRPVGWILKDVAYKFPFRTVLRWLGAIPVNRRAPEGFVGQASRKFVEGNSSILCIAPEGTRRKAERWKTGFYRIAQESNAPIILGFLDYERRVGGVGPLIWPTGDYDADMRRIADFYRDIVPRVPDYASEIR